MLPPSKQARSDGSRAITPDERMDCLRQFLHQVCAYLGREERGNAVSQLRRRSYSHYVMLEQLEERGSLTSSQLDRWKRIQADYHTEVPEMFSESV